MYYGWRAKIGIVFPSTGVAPEYEFHKYAPEGVAPLTQRVLFERVDPSGLTEMSERVAEASKLLSIADLIVFACTSGSLIKGIGYDEQLIQQIQQASGVRTITTSTAVVRALRALHAKKVAVATPYSDEVNRIEKRFLEDSGFEVLAIQGLGNVEPNLMSFTTVADMYRLTKEVLHPQADAIFVSCTGIGIADGIVTMERDFGLPVVTSNQASLWAALRELSIRDDVGLGQLFKL